MTDPRSAQRDRQAFEKLCGEVDEYEPLPSVEPPDQPQDGGLDAEAQGRLDAEILGGLVSP